MKPGYCVSLYTLPDLKGEEFWQHLQSMEVHGCLLLPERDRGLIEVDNKDFWLPEKGNMDEWKRMVKEAQAPKCFTIFPLIGENFVVRCCFFILPDSVCSKCSWRKGYVRDKWGYEILISFSRSCLVSQGRRLCDLVMELCKDLFLQLPCDFGFSCHDDLYEIQREWLLRSLRNIIVPTISDLSFWIAPHLRLKDWRRVEDKPVWFYLLSRERYQETKPFLSSIYIEAKDIFPNIEDSYGMRYIEELPNGGAFVFLDYPYILEE